MPDITLSVPHQLSREEAKRRIQDEITKVQEQYANKIGRLEQQWQGDILNFSVAAMGVAVSGKLIVEDHQVWVTVAVPWPLALLAGGVKQTIEQRGRLLLGHR
jgi:hypothetical protein